MSLNNSNRKSISEPNSKDKHFNPLKDLNQNNLLSLLLLVNLSRSLGKFNCLITVVTKGSQAIGLEIDTKT